MSEVAAMLFAAIIALLVVFQVALAAGAPLGAYAWGGQHPGRLPVRLRVGSIISVLIYAAMAAIVLGRAGVVDWLPDAVVRVGAWVVFGYLVLGTLMNLVSRSLKERAVMTPVAAILAVLALLVALG